MFRSATHIESLTCFVSLPCAEAVIAVSASSIVAMSLYSLNRCIVISLLFEPPKVAKNWWNNTANAKFLLSLPRYLFK